MTRSRLFPRFRRDETGAVTVEAAIWLPFWIFMVVAVGDLAVVFNAQTRALEMAEDGLRLYAVGEIATPAEASTWIENRLDPISPNAKAETSVIFGLIHTEVVLPVRDINGFGILASLRNFDIRVNAQQVMEFGG